MAPHSTFSRKKWNGVPVLAAKNSTLLPKMELLFILANRQKRTPHGKRCQFGCQIYINFSVKLTFYNDNSDIFTIIFSDNSKTSQLLQELSLQLRGILKWQLTSFYAATFEQEYNSHLKSFHKLWCPPPKFAQCDMPVST